MMYVNEETGRGEAGSGYGVAKVHPATWAEIYSAAIAESQGKCGYADASRFIKRDNRRNGEDS